MVESIIPNGWAKVKFSDYIIFQEGPGLMSFLFKETGFPFVNIRCIENGSINKETCQFISGDIANGVYKHFQLEEDDLIVSTSGTLGKKAFVKKTDLPLLLNTSIIRFKPKNTDNISLYFLNYLLEDYSFLYDLYSQSTGSAQVNVGPSHLKKLFIKIPKSITEQQSIANILTKTDQAIANTEALIAKYTHIKTGLMQDLLTKGIGNDEFELVRTDLKNIKAKSNFHITTLKTITKVRQGYQIAISARKKEEGENRFVYITVQYLNNPKKYLEYIENPPVEVISKYDDILFTRTGNTGQIVTDIVGVYHNNFFKVDFDKKLITKEYLLLFLQWKPVKDLILELAGTTTIPDLKHKDFYSIPIFFPKTLKEQNTITTSINKANEVVERFETELSKLQSLKTGLMQDLLSGKVRVKKLIQDANGK